LSLTADDGTWVQLPDFRGHLHVVLAFLRDVEAPETTRFLRDLDAARDRLATLDAAAYGVSTARPDALRAVRARHGLGVPLLYDPFALVSRGFHASGMLRPRCCDVLVAVGKDGAVLHAARGLDDLEGLLAAIARAEGRAVPPARDVREDAPTAPAPWRDIDPAGALALLGAEGSTHVLVDVRTREEFRSGHVPGARHIPVDELPHRHAELGQDSRLLFICAAGARSAAAAEFMASIGGTDLYNVAVGMSGWTGPRVIPE
jgi:rhodanese-related sulfurtransferase